MPVRPGPPPAGPAPGALAATSCVEVQRLVNAAGIITLGNQVIQVGSPLAGQRARIRLDGQVMHVITQDGVLWRTLPCPIPPGQRHKLQGVRLAGPEPLPPQAQTVQRKVSSRGGIQVARQRIQVGFSHAGKTVTIQLGDTTPADHRPARRADHHRAPKQHWRDQPVQGLRQAGNHAGPHSSNHTRYREGGDLMTAVTLNATDAAELAEMLQFLADWLKRDPDRLRASLEDFVGHPAYNTRQLQRGPGPVHLPARRQRRGISLRLTAVTAAPKRASPASRGYAGPSRRQRRSSSRCALRALHVDPAVGSGADRQLSGKATGPADVRGKPWQAIVTADHLRRQCPYTICSPLVSVPRPTWSRWDRQ